MSTFGIAAIILYAPSGIVADKFSHRKVMTFAMIATGLLGGLMAFYPPFWVMILIQVAFAITTILLLWSVSIKAASLLGNHEEQGKIMGWMEGLRGVGRNGAGGVHHVDLLFIRYRGSQQPQSGDPDLQRRIYSARVLCWFFVSEGSSQTASSSTEPSPPFSLGDILRVLKVSSTWYCSMIIFGVYTIYAILSYSTNYLTEMYGMTLVAASYMGIVINKIFRAICGPLGGLITSHSRLKSPTRVIQLLALVSLITLGALLVTNQQPGSVAVGIGLILLLAFACYASRRAVFRLYW
jgi:sugar phosphate permease